MNFLYIDKKHSHDIVIKYGTQAFKDKDFTEGYWKENIFF